MARFGARAALLGVATFLVCVYLDVRFSPFPYIPMAAVGSSIKQAETRKMPQHYLIAFDFDHTILEGNSDVVVRNLIPSCKIPHSTKMYRKTDWIDYMENIFLHLHQEGITESDIRKTIHEIPPVTGMIPLLDFLSKPIFEVIIISDSNSVFISTWLEHYRRLCLVRQIYTNPAEFDSSGQLHVRKYHLQNWCKLSSVNMCKGYILDEHIKRRQAEGVNFTSVAYVGDGDNDYCPSLRLSSRDHVFPRCGYTLEKLVRNGVPDYEPVKAAAHVWSSGQDIIHVLRRQVINTQECLFA